VTNSRASTPRGYSHPARNFLKQKRFVAGEKEKIAKRYVIIKSFLNIKNNRDKCQNELTEYMQ
jgi:hypothetical protein